MLHHLGWSLSALENPQPLAFGRSRVPRAQWQMAPLPDGQFLMLIALEENLPALDDAFKAYEDLTTLHAELRLALRNQQLSVRHVLLTDPHLGAQLIDFEAEDILIDARGEGEMIERLLPVLSLNKLAAGSLTMFPRKTLGRRARELADWTKVWSTRIGAAAKTTPATVSQFFYWLLLARLAERLSLLPPRKTPFCDYAVAPSQPKPVRYLDRLYRPLHDTWNFLQASSLPVTKRVAELAAADDQLAPCLESFSRLSVSKFSANVFAEAFADDELRSVGWRHSLIEREETSEDPNRWLVERVDVDLDAVGFAGLLSRFDTIAEDLRRLAREQEVLRTRGERTGLQLDFFGEEPPALKEEDAARIALERTLRVCTAQRSRAAVARFVLLAHAAEWEARLRQGEPIFPELKIMTTEPPRRPRLDATPELN